MRNQPKWSIMARLGAVGIMLLIAGIYMIVTSVKDSAAMSKGFGDFNAMKAADFEKGMFVEGDISILYDEFAYEESYDRTFGVKHNERVTSHYFVMPLPGADYEEYIAVEISNSEVAEQANKMIEEFWAMYDSGEIPDEMTTIHLKGKVVKMEKKIKDYFFEYLMYDSEDQDPANYEHLTSPYMIQYYTESSVKTSLPIAVVMALIGAVLTAVVVMIYIKGRKESGSGSGIAGNDLTYYNNDDSLEAQIARSSSNSSAYRPSTETAPSDGPAYQPVGSVKPADSVSPVSPSMDDISSQMPDITAYRNSDDTNSNNSSGLGIGIDE